MAKLKGPLFALGARGKLAGSLVYFPWKGVDAVREYVVPANPKSTAQTTQRTYFTNAITEWHAALYTDGDRTGWNRFAGTLAEIMSGFNAFCRTFINEAILENTWTRMRDARVDPVLATAFRVLLEKVSGGLAPTLRYGTSPTFMPNTIVMSDLTGNLWEAAPAGLTASTLYYWTIDVGVSGATYGRLGIYAQRTAAA